MGAFVYQQDLLRALEYNFSPKLKMMSTSCQIGLFSTSSLNGPPLVELQRVSIFQICFSLIY